MDENMANESETDAWDIETDVTGTDEIGTEETGTDVSGVQAALQNDPQNNPYSPLYQPDKEKKHKNILMLIMIFLFVALLAAAMIIALSKVIQTAMKEANAYIESEDGIITRFERYMDERIKEKEAEALDDRSDDWDDDSKYQDENRDGKGAYVPSLNDPYYVELTNSIRDDLPYRILWEDYQYDNSEKNVEITICYPVLEGDVKNMENINAVIQENALYFMKNYANRPESGNISDCYLEVDSYVTYMSEEICSIVIDEYFWMNELSSMDLYCINVDLMTGQILENSSILRYSEKLAKEFREKSNYQNGHVDAVDMLSDEELADFLSDEVSAIVFYTPLGIEIGFNYSFEDTSGWVTTTIKDYGSYLYRM